MMTNETWMTGSRRLGASIIRCGLFDRRHNVGILLSEFFFRHVCNLRFIFISGRDRCGIGFIENGEADSSASGADEVAGKPNGGNADDGDETAAVVANAVKAYQKTKGGKA